MIRLAYLRWLLLAVAVGCIVVGVFPHWSEMADPATGERIRERRHGLWSSPSYSYVHRDLTNGGFRLEEGINWLSWSSLMVLVGVGVLELLRRRSNGPVDRRREESGG